MEHRWGRRLVVDIPIEIIASAPSRTNVARIANISVTGAFIEVDFRPRLLSRVQIGFSALPRSQADVVNIAAYVIRNDRHGIGVEWCGLTSAAAAGLLRAAGAQSDRAEHIAFVAPRGQRHLLTVRYGGR